MYVHNSAQSKSNAYTFQNSSVPVFFSLKKTLLLVLYFYTGLLPFIPLRESLLEVVMPSIVLQYA